MVGCGLRREEMDDDYERYDDGYAAHEESNSQQLVEGGYLAHSLRA